jgi:hypothetical protein
MRAMHGWIYVLELAPSGWVKVGKTETLSKRVARHIGTARFGGGRVVSVLSFAADDMDSAERNLLIDLAAHPGATLVHGRETFAGLPFMEVARLADRVVGYRKGAAWKPEPDLQGRCAAAMDAAGITRISLNHLRILLGDGGPPNNHDLGRELRRGGCVPDAVRCKHEGRTMQGIKREWLALVPTALSAETAPAGAVDQCSG